VGVNLHGRSTKKVKLLLNDSHLEPHAVRPQHHHRDDDLEYRKPECNEQRPPFLAHKISKWFMTLPLELLQVQPAEVH
jgi:hypothetical protein